MSGSDLFDVTGFGVIVTGGAEPGSGSPTARRSPPVGPGSPSSTTSMRPRWKRRCRGLPGRDWMCGARSTPTSPITTPWIVPSMERREGLRPPRRRLCQCRDRSRCRGFVGAWAGGQRPRMEEGALELYTDERWNRVIDINLNGIFATARAAAVTCARGGSAGSSSPPRWRRPRWSPPSAPRT